MASQKKRQYQQVENSQTRYKCHQLLPMVFGLNNSYGKIIHVGLENSSCGSDDFKPIVRLGSNQEFYGFSLPLDTWRKFQDQFDQIDRFFSHYNGEEEELLDRQISIPGYTIRFMISFSDRAFELMETSAEDESVGPMRKKYRKPSLVFKRVTFERLKSLSPIIDCRIKYLMKVKDGISIIVKSLGDYIKDVLTQQENAQFEYFTSYNVQRAMRGFDESLVNKLDKTLKDKNVNLAIDDISIIIYEFINLHTYNLVTYLNTIVYKDS